MYCETQRNPSPYPIRRTCDQLCSPLSAHHFRHIHRNMCTLRPPAILRQFFRLRDNMRRNSLSWGTREINLDEAYLSEHKIPCGHPANDTIKVESATK